MSIYLLEVGTEELPYKFIPQAIEQLNSGFANFLNDNKVKFSDIKVYSTPRRLAVIIDGLDTKTADEVKDAYRGYKDINLTAMKIVKSGGFLLTCSCSHYMSFNLFEKMLMEAARESGRNIRSVEIKTQAPDHPSLLCADETQYLKFFVLQVI